MINGWQSSKFVDDMLVAAKLLVLNTEDVSSKTNASVVLTGGIAIQKNLNVYGKS